MMNKQLVWPLAAVLVVALVWFLDGGDEERAIQARLEQIRVLAEITGPETPLSLLRRAKEISALLAPETRYDLTNLDHGITTLGSRDELIQHIVAIGSKLKSLQLELLAPVIRIDGDQAIVTLTGTALGATHHGEGQFLEVHRVEIDLMRTDDEWLVRGGRHIRDERNPFSEPRS